MSATSEDDGVRVIWAFQDGIDLKGGDIKYSEVWPLNVYSLCYRHVDHTVLMHGRDASPGVATYTGLRV